MNPWMTLLLAGLLEIVWASTLKKTDGFTRLWPSVLTLGAMAVSFWLLSRAMRSLPAGTSYAVWVGIGAAGTAVVGALLFKETLRPAQVACIALILAGVVGLKLSATPPGSTPTGSLPLSAAAPRG